MFKLTGIEHKISSPYHPQMIFHNDIGQSGDRHCREALQYNEHLLHEQLYSPQHLRSGADRLCYRAEEDEEFGVSKGMCINNFIIPLILNISSTVGITWIT